jgi:hypothetical protein
MIYPIWRLSEYAPDNLGLACTDDGLLLGHTPLIERRDGRFVVRARDEIERLLKRAYLGEPPIDRLMSGPATVASALNANDQCLARIAAVHLELPDLPSRAARDAMVAEDALIKYTRDEGGSSNWNPALHPRTGVPPNPGWFATTGGPQHESSKDGANQHDVRPRFAENQDVSRRTDAAKGPSRHRAILSMSRRLSLIGSARWISRATAIFGPTFGHPSGTGSMNRCLSTTSRAVRWWGNGRAGKPSHLMSALRLRLLRSSALRRSRRRSQRGSVSAVARPKSALVRRISRRKQR